MGAVLRPGFLKTWNRRSFEKSLRPCGRAGYSSGKLTRKGDRLTSFDATVQASGGKFDGWHLGFADEVEQIEKGKFKYKSYRPQLSEKPGPRTNLHIFIDGP